MRVASATAAAADSLRSLVVVDIWYLLALLSDCIYLRNTSKCIVHLVTGIVQSPAASGAEKIQMSITDHQTTTATGSPPPPRGADRGARAISRLAAARHPGPVRPARGLAPTGAWLRHRGLPAGPGPVRDHDEHALPNAPPDGEGRLPRVELGARANRSGPPGVHHHRRRPYLARFLGGDAHCLSRDDRPILRSVPRRPGRDPPAGRSADQREGDTAMTKAEEASRATDPFEVWRQLYDTNERAWSAALEQAMSSPEAGEASGKLFETMLAAQKSVRDNMRTYLESMNVPTREDIARLGELVIGLEEKIDQLADRLAAVEGAVRHPR